MTSLLKRSQNVRQSLAKARVANKTKLQLSTIQNLQTAWSTKKSKALTAWTKLSWFGPASADDPDLRTTHDGVKALALEAQTLLKSSDDVQELSRNDLWTRLLKLADTATSMTEVAVKQVWDAHIEAAGTLDSPERIDSLMPKTPANTVALQSYRETFASFKVLKTKPTPTSEQDIAELARYAAQLHKTFQGFVLDMPDEVKVFQQALIAGNAGLKLLTPTVWKWLDENDDINRFVIRVSSNYGSQT